MYQFDMLCRLKLPVAYHSRSSSVVVSGTDVPRPRSFARYSLMPVLEYLEIDCKIRFLQMSPWNDHPI